MFEEVVVSSMMLALPRICEVLTVLQLAVVPHQTVVWSGVAPRPVSVPVRVPTVVLLQPYVGFSRVRIPTVKHTNTDSHVMPKESHRGFSIARRIQ